MSKGRKAKVTMAWGSTPRREDQRGIKFDGTLYLAVKEALKKSDNPKLRKLARA